MAFMLTVRLNRETIFLLRRGAVTRDCAQKVVLEAAISDFAARRAELLALSPVPIPTEGSQDALIFAKQKRSRRRFRVTPEKFTTTISEETQALLKNLIADYTRADLVERSLRFYLWAETRRDFRDFLEPKITTDYWGNTLQK